MFKQPQPTRVKKQKKLHKKDQQKASKLPPTLSQRRKLSTKGSITSTTSSQLSIKPITTSTSQKLHYSSLSSQTTTKHSFNSLITTNTIKKPHQSHNGIPKVSKMTFSSTPDPRSATHSIEVLEEMNEARPQTLSERLTMSFGLLLRTRRDKKLWAQWDQPPQFNAKYAIEVYELMLQALDNPISDYSGNMHFVAKRSADLDYPILKQLHLLNIAHNQTFLHTFQFLEENGIEFPWDEDEIVGKLKVPVEYGIAPEVSIFLEHVNELLFNPNYTTKSPKVTKKESSPYVHTLPQTYGVELTDPTVKLDDENKNQNSQNDNKNDQNMTKKNTVPNQNKKNKSQDESENSDESGSSDTESDENDGNYEDVVVENSPVDIAQLRHLVKVHQMKTFGLSIELDHTRFSSNYLSLDQIRKISVRFLNTLNNPVVRNRIDANLKDDVDPLGSFDEDELDDWQNDRYTSILKTLTPFLTKVVTDEFKMKGDQGLVSVQAALEQHLWDTKIAHNYGQFRTEIARYLTPPVNSPQLRIEMAKEQERRRLSAELMQRRQNGQEDENFDLEAYMKEHEEEIANAASKAVSNIKGNRKQDKWKQLEEEFDNGELQLENLRVLYGDNYNPETGKNDAPVTPPSNTEIKNDIVDDADQENVDKVDPEVVKVVNETAAQTAATPAAPAAATPAPAAPAQPVKAQFIHPQQRRPSPVAAATAAAPTTPTPKQ